MADDDLREQLTDIHGIGDAKASEILDVLDDVTVDADAGTGVGDQVDVDELRRLLDDAVDHFDAVDEMSVTAQAGAERARRARTRLDESG